MDFRIPCNRTLFRVIILVPPNSTAIIIRTPRKRTPNLWKEPLNAYVWRNKPWHPLPVGNQTLADFETVLDKTPAVGSTGACGSCKGVFVGPKGG